MTRSVPRVTLAAGYDISQLLKGGWQLAGGHGAVTATAAMADMDRFVTAGITTFDCADIYTGVESLIGGWLRHRRAEGDRVDVQIHTKYVPDRDRLPTLSRDAVADAIDRSLQRLGVERLDVVQFHWWDFAVPRYLDVMGWLDELRHHGKIAHLGLTNFDLPHLREIVDAGIPIVSHQVQYSVLDRRPAGEMAAFCLAHGIGLLCYGTLAGGFLSGRYLGVPDPRPPLENRSLVKYRLIVEECGGWSALQQLLTALHTVSTRHGVGLGSVALRWALDQPGVAGVIVGARNATHLRETAAACQMKLDVGDRDAITRVLEQVTGPQGDVYTLERDNAGPHAAVMRYTLNR